VLENISAGKVGHFYASCGNCGNVGPRQVIARDITVTAAKYEAFAVQNGDRTPQLTNVHVGSGPICSWYNGNASTHTSCASNSETASSGPSTSNPSSSNSSGSNASNPGSSNSNSSSSNPTSSGQQKGRNWWQWPFFG
jgi:hypothetical protein